MSQNFKELKVWQQAFEFANKIYTATSKFPREEIYGLTSQMRRAAVSISTNIAEGCGRRTNKDFCQFLYSALGSTKECESLLLFAQKQNFLDNADFSALNNEIDHIGKRLTLLIQSVQNKEE